MNFMDLLLSAGPFIGGAASAGVFKGPVDTLQNWWFVKFGASKSFEAAVLRQKHALEIQKLRDSTLREVKKISPENVQEPALNIIGPTLEASKYYIEEENIREMFSKILASSMDKSKNSMLHPSFIEILKQMNKTDTIILESLKPLSFHSYYPIMRIKTIELDNGNHFRNIVPMIAIFKDSPSYTDNQNSIYNLERLGLLDISFNIQPKSNEYKNLYDENTMLNNVLENLYENNLSNEKFKIEDGSIILTDLGNNFLRICSPS